jgi:hypothetical protein
MTPITLELIPVPKGYVPETFRHTYLGAHTQRNEWRKSIPGYSSLFYPEPECPETEYSARHMLRKSVLGGRTSYWEEVVWVRRSTDYLVTRLQLGMNVMRGYDAHMYKLYSEFFNKHLPHHRRSGEWSLEALEDFRALSEGWSPVCAQDTVYGNSHDLEIYKIVTTTECSPC